MNIVQVVQNFVRGVYNHEGVRRENTGPILFGTCVCPTF